MAMQYKSLCMEILAENFASTKVSSVDRCRSQDAYNEAAAYILCVILWVANDNLWTVSS